MREIRVDRTATGLIRRVSVDYDSTAEISAMVAQQRALTGPPTDSIGEHAVFGHVGSSRPGLPADLPLVMSPDILAEYRSVALAAEATVIVSGRSIYVASPCGSRSRS